MPRMKSRTYSQIVWRQFADNRPAYWSLLLLAPLFATVVFAPVLASNQPFVFWDGRRVLFPWFRALFAFDESVNFFFNMSLVTFFPWVLVVVLMKRRWRSRSLPRYRQIRRSLGLFAVLTFATTAVFALPAVRPAQIYASRNFAGEQHESSDKYGFYAPIPFGPVEQDLKATFKPPLYRKPVAERHESTDDHRHLLGTDNTGRDVLAQLLYGTRVSVTVGFLAVGLYLTIGSVVGAVAGYFGGMLDMLISRVIEIVLLFPAFFLILTLVALIGPNIYIVMFVIGITGWPTVARLIRAEVLRQRSLDYVVAAQSFGASHARIIFRHLLPNSLGPALVAAPFGVSNAVMTEAGLSVLGFGVRPPTPSWGTLLQLGSANYHHWWLIVVPSLAIFTVITLFNLVGSGLRDAMDPKLRR